MACIHVFRAAYQEAWLLDLGLRLIASVERERKTEPLREAGKSAANGSGASPRDGASRTNVAPGCLSRQADATRAAPSVLLVSPWSRAEASFAAMATAIMFRNSTSGVSLARLSKSEFSDVTRSFAERGVAR